MYNQYLLNNNLWFYTQNFTFFSILPFTGYNFTDVTEIEKIVFIEFGGGWICKDNKQLPETKWYYNSQAVVDIGEGEVEGVWALESNQA